MRVGIATSDRKSVNAHFAQTPIFMFYDLTKDGFYFVKEIIVEEEDVSKVLEQNEFHSKNLEKCLAAVKGCQLLFVKDIGKTAYQKALLQDTLSIKTVTAKSIEDVIILIQELIKNNPPLWLKRVMKKELTLVRN